MTIMDLVIACMYLAVVVLCGILFTVTASGFFLLLGTGACLVIACVCGVRVYMPWNNLGCLGIRAGQYYADVFWRPYLGMVVSTPHAVRWINTRGIRAKTKTPCALHVIRNSRGEW